MGCSGWQYRHWIGPFYPPELLARQRFAFYASRFDTVELNTTFYRLPTPTAVESWAAAAPPGFRYAVKVGAFGSHRMKLRDAAGWLPNHLSRVRLLGPALGPNLVQLPGRWRADVGRLREFLDVAAELAPEQRWAVELRHPDWLRAEVYDALAAHDAALVLHDLLPGLPWERTASWVYCRFHGPAAVDAPYQGRYGRRRLAVTAGPLRAWLDQGHDVFAYFNNDEAAHATHDAAALRDLLGVAGPGDAPM